METLTPSVEDQQYNDKTEQGRSGLPQLTDAEKASIPDTTEPFGAPFLVPQEILPPIRGAGTHTQIGTGTLQDNKRTDTHIDEERETD